MARAALGKISTKIIMKGVKDWDAPPEDGSVKYLYDVMGAARAMRVGESNYGRWASFVGTCGAVRHADGQKFRGDECFLPGMAAGRVESFLDQIAKAGGGTVEYGYRIGIKKGDGGQRYNFHVEPLFDEGEADPLDALMAKAAPLPSLEDKSAPPAQPAASAKKTVKA